jgi:hypothetical protein
LAGYTCRELRGRPHRATAGDSMGAVRPKHALGAVAFFWPADKHGREGEVNLGRGSPPPFVLPGRGRWKNKSKNPDATAAQYFTLRDNLVSPPAGADIMTCCNLSEVGF